MGFYAAYFAVNALDPFGLEEVIIIYDGSDKGGDDGDLAAGQDFTRAAEEKKEEHEERGDSVAMIDAGEGSYQELMECIKEAAGDDPVTVYIIDHGSPGNLEMGNAIPGFNFFNNFASGSNICLYGCDIAQGEKGEEFLSSNADSSDNTISAYTGPTRYRRAGWFSDWWPTGEKVTAGPDGKLTRESTDYPDTSPEEGCSKCKNKKRR